MKLVLAMIRPNKLEEVKDSLSLIGCLGMTVTEVRGHGREKHNAIWRGTEYPITFLPKIQLEIFVSDSDVTGVVTTIMEMARTGEIGDGRIFVLPVEEGWNIRNGEPEP